MNTARAYRPFGPEIFRAINRAQTYLRQTKTQPQEPAIVARNQMVVENMGLVGWVLRQIDHQRIGSKDLIQEGTIGLMRAVEKHDPAKGTIATYGTWWIRQAIMRARAEKEQGRIIRVPIHTIEELAKMVRAERKLQEELGRDPSLEEIACRTKFNLEKISKLKAIPVAELCLDEPVRHEDYVQPADVLDEQSPNGLEILVDTSLSQNLTKALHGLTSIEKYVIVKRYGLYGEEEQTLQEIANHFNLSRERIRQIEQKALKKLAHPTRSADLRLFLDRTEDPFSA